MKKFLMFALAACAGFGQVESAMAKSVSLLGVTCSQGTQTSALYQKQGSLFRNLGFNGGTGAVAGIWHTTITDNGAIVLLDFTDTDPRVAPSIILASTTLAKGVHVLTYRSENSTSGETCDFQISTKV